MSQSAQLKERQTEAVGPGIGTKSVYVKRAENAELWDVDGNRFIDFAAGIAVNNTGHCHPKVMAAVNAQMANFTHTCFHVAPYESYIALAERLNALAPGDFKKKTIFLTTGAEAVENAIKVARHATGRSAVIAFNGAFHGRTLMGMALTGKVNPYKKGFGPFPAEIYHAPFPNAYHDISVEDALDALNHLLSVDVDPGRVAAFIVEPVQGEGGFTIAPTAFLQALRQIADEHGILLISDEVQAGFARTGTMFGINHSGVVPDLITMAKGLAGGFPLSAVTGRADLMDSVHPGGLGGTYAGSPMGVAAANAVLDIIDEDDLCARSTDIGEIIQKRLKSMSERNTMTAIGEVRGLGAMVAMELVKDRDSKEPDPALTAALVAEAEKRGLILLSCGTRANVIRLLCPLTISDDVLNEGLDIIEASMETLVAN